MSKFEYQVYGNNSSEDIINKMQAKAEAQNALAQTAGGFRKKIRGGSEVHTVPQFASRGDEVSPVNSNDNIANIARAQLRADVIQDAQSNTGEVIKGGYKNRRSRRSRKYRKRRNRKSRKY